MNQSVLLLIHKQKQKELQNYEKGNVHISQQERY